MGLNVRLDPILVDIARDTLAAVAAGLLLMVVGNWAKRHRATQDTLDHHGKRLDRHGIEIRHTQERTGVAPFYHDDL